jgi:RNA-directed DNA polymerase
VSFTALHAERLTQGETRWSISPLFVMRNPSLLCVLARSFLAGEPTVEQITARASRTLGREWRWLPPLAQRYLKTIGGRTRPRHRDVIQFFLDDRGFRRAWSKHFHELSVEQWLTEPQQMQPVPAAGTWDVPRIESVGALCDWLWLEPGQLEWFADLKGLCYKNDRPRINHYHYRVLSKRDGNIRLIEAPKPRLKKLQGQILTEILERIPPHPSVHGFIKGRSIRTFAAPHAGQRVVLRMDLSDFFPTFAAARIQTLFRTMGYPEPVADLLGGICTNAAPRDLCRGFPTESRGLYSRPHLPQGAPASPALANLGSYRLDCRLSGLAESAGASYTRYADDLAFSGGEEFEKRVERFSTHVAAILLEEGFTVNHRKTRIMRQGVRQHLAGLVVNQHMNVRRSDFDLLKATLTNCVRLGPDTQNRSDHPSFRAHLEGRVGFVESINPPKGKRLRAILERIQW